MTMGLIVYAGASTLPAWLVYLTGVLGSIGLVLAVRWIAQDAEARAAARRVLSMTCFAVGLSVLLLSVQVIAAEYYVIVSPCSEAYLQQTCGDWWEWCWWLNGCFMAAP